MKLKDRATFFSFFSRRQHLKSPSY